MNVLWGQSDEESKKEYGRRRAPVNGDPDDVERILDTLLDSKKPIIIAGHGVLYAEAWDELMQLAELLQIPVTTSLWGRVRFQKTMNYHLEFLVERSQGCWSFCK